MKKFFSIRGANVVVFTKDENFSSENSLKLFSAKFTKERGMFAVREFD